MSTTYVQILMPKMGTVFVNSVESIFGVIRKDADNASFLELTTAGRQTVCRSVELFMDNVGEILTLGEGLKRLGKGSNPKTVRSKFKKLSPFTDSDIELVLGRKPEAMSHKESGRIHLPRPVGVFNASDNRVNSNALLLEAVEMLDPAITSKISDSKVKIYTYESIAYEVKPPAVWWYYLSCMEGNIKTASLNIDADKVVNKITIQQNLWKVPDIF